MAIPLQFGLIGYPLQNSFSVNYFNQKFADLGVNAQYQNFPLQHIQQFPKLLNDNPNICGLNVTIPHKQDIIAYLNQVDEHAKQIGAVNVIVKHNNVLVGHNTDYAGFTKSILPFLKPWHQQALILGWGGAAKAVAYALSKLGIKYHIVSRNNVAHLNYEEVDKSIIRSCQIIINCTPLGMYPNTEAFPQIPYQFITDKHLAYDLIYKPDETAFLSKSKQQGAVTVNGLMMLHHQADEAWKIWQAAFINLQ